MEILEANKLDLDYTIVRELKNSNRNSKYGFLAEKTEYLKQISKHDCYSIIETELLF